MRAQKVLWLLLAATIGLFVLCVLVLHMQGRSLEGLLPPCSLYSQTGICCAGCGGTRAIESLLHGQWLQSARYHIFVPYGAVLGGLFLLSPVLYRFTGHRFLMRPIYFYVAIVLVLLQWGIRIVMALNGQAVF